MRILIVSHEGDGCGVAYMLAQEGHDVTMSVEVASQRKAGGGMYRVVDHWREAIGRADLVVCDMVGWGKYEERWREMGKPVISCNMVMDQAELDREKGMFLFRSVGITIPETYSYPNPAAARTGIKGMDWGTGWVIKPSGNADTCKTFVVKEQEIFDYCLDQVSGPLIVQRIVEGIEISTEGWFNGRDWVRPFNHTFEEKCFLNDNLGPATGCQGNVVFATPSNRLTRASVERLKPFLVAVGYRGPVDVNCIVDQHSAYALEISARLGYDAIDALAAGLEEPLADLLFETATGTKKSMRLTNKAMIAVRLSIPPWPHGEPEAGDYGAPIRGLDAGALRHVVLYDVYRDGGGYFTAGGDGVLLKATALGGANGEDYTREARRRVYNTLEGIKVSGKQYRTDIGTRVNGDLKQLKEWGWL